MDPEVRKRCYKLLGERVKKLRQERFATQFEMIRESGIHSSQWSKVERGANITTDTLFDVAAALGVTPCDLLEGMPANAMKPERSRKKANAPPDLA